MSTPHEQPKISRVYKWANGLVMVFDQYGQQMFAYQGRYDEVRDKIRASAGDEVEYYAGDWRVSSIEQLDTF